MSWRDAPLVVQAHDLAQTLLKVCDAEPFAPQPALRRHLADGVLGLLSQVSIALSFPADRPQAWRAADRHVCTLKVLVRPAGSTQVL